MELGLYRDIVETSADGIWVFDLEARTLYANPALATMFGVSREEFSGVTIFDSLDEVGRQQFRAHLVDIRAGRFNTEDVEVQFVRADGSTMWVLVGEQPLRAPDGTVTAVLHRLTDYSGRRRIVEELRASQEQLAEAQRIARIGSWKWDVEHDVITASQGLLDIYGMSPDAVPTDYRAFLEIVHEEDRELVVAAVQTALEGGELGFEARLQGETDWVWTRGRGITQFAEDGRPVSMAGTHQDITETKLAELALQDQISQNTLMQLVSSAANEARTLADVLVHARSLVLLHDDWARGRGFLVAEDGRSLEPLYVREGDREEDEADVAASARDRALAERCLVESASVWDDARLTIAFPVRHRGRVHAVIVITSDPPLYRHDMIQAQVEQVAVQLERVVEREEAERALATARDQAMEASRQKSEFLATMSHEIRTPLNGVIGLNDLLLRTRLDPDQQRFASGVQMASRALLGLINDILDFSKIEAGKLQLEHVEFEVRDVLDQVANVLGEAARAKGLDLMVSCSASVPAILVGDPTRLAQVVTNLTSNAIKFTEAGEVFVHASAARSDEPTAGRTTLRVEVSDTGIGIDASDVDTLFDSFTQADASTTRVHGGTGLGLAISREIVHALGGEIGVDSSAGHGSVFWFSAQLDRPATPPTELPDEAALTRLAGRRALVVDESPRHRAVLAEQLGWWRLRCDAVASAPEAESALAAALAEDDPYDVVLIDRTLADPLVDGLALAGNLREEPAYDDTTLLLLTATTDLDTTTVREHGIADFLVKPVLVHDLRTALLHHLAGVAPPVTAEDRTRRGRARPRILVVEDNPVNQMVAVGLLDALGYDADTADDGQAAVDAFVAGRYDAVLMDVQMPRLDGYAATRAIRAREDGSRTPVLAMTAAAIEGERERCLAAGMDDFLTKPVDPDALAATLTRWLSEAKAGHRSDADATRPATAPLPAGTEGLDLDRLDMLRDMDPGNPAYLDGAIGNFVVNTPDQLEAVRAAVVAGDHDALRQAAHKLAGSAGNLGVRAAAERARELEVVADGGSTQGADALVERLGESLEQGRVGLLAYRDAFRGGDTASGTGVEGVAKG